MIGRDLHALRHVVAIVRDHAVELHNLIIGHGDVTVATPLGEGIVLVATAPALGVGSPEIVCLCRR